MTITPRQYLESYLAGIPESDGVRIGPQAFSVDAYCLEGNIYDTEARVRIQQLEREELIELIEALPIADRERPLTVAAVRQWQRRVVEEQARIRSLQEDRRELDGLKSENASLRAKQQARDKAIQALEQLLRNRMDRVEELEKRRAAELAEVDAKVDAKVDAAVAGVMERVHSLGEELRAAQVDGESLRAALRDRQQALELAQQALDAVHASTSWRWSRPIRIAGRQWQRVRSVLYLGRRYARQRGGGVRGLLGLSRRVIEIGKAKGLSGVVDQVRRYARYVYAPPSPRPAGGEVVPAALSDAPVVDAASATIAAAPVVGDPAREAMAAPLAAGWDFPIQGERRGPELVAHRVSVDIVVCVHNALDDVRRCLSSVLRCSLPPYGLIIVDDGSGPETAGYLEAFAEDQGARLLRNEQAKGYTFAANQGLRASHGEYVVLLNSDTIVSEDWLDRMVMCAQSDSAIGLVGPLSNTASWQSVPRIESDGDWAENPLPEGVDIGAMATLIARESGRVYPRLPFLNGFCLMISRALIEAIGRFDEQGFGAGYGEENDYCLRAREAGWSLVVADDVYIHHAQSKSYSHQRRKQLCDLAGRELARKHGQEAIDQGVDICRYDRVMEGIRVRVLQSFHRRRLRRSARDRWDGLRVVFVLPIAEPGGGGNVIINEARALREMGVDAHLLNLACNQSSFEAAYPKLGLTVLYADSERHVAELCVDYDAVVATVNTSVGWIAPLGGGADPRILAYYVQDFEPAFYQAGTWEYDQALASYIRAPEMQCFTKTEWNRDRVLERTGRECQLLAPSVDTDLFRPRPTRDEPWPRRPLRIAAMIRPSTPRRNPRLTMQVLAAVKADYGENIEVILFGVDAEDPGFIALPHDFDWRTTGRQSPEKLAFLFNEVDIFVDFSSFQAMGLTAMEAMACGVAVIAPQEGGSNSFIRHGHNGLLIDTAAFDACYDALKRLILDQELRVRLGRHAVHDIACHYPEDSAYRMMEILFPERKGGGVA